MPRSNLSLPSLGAWIETPSIYIQVDTRNCRSLHWERGLKPDENQSKGFHPKCRSLHWERGLKPAGLC